MEKNELLEIVKNLPNDKRDKLAEMFDKCATIINNAECEMHGTGYKLSFLLDDAVTMWCNLYDLKRIFAVDYEKQTNL